MLSYQVRSGRMNKRGPVHLLFFLSASIVIRAGRRDKSLEYDSVKKKTESEKLRLLFLSPVQRCAPPPFDASITQQTDSSCIGDEKKIERNVYWGQSRLAERAHLPPPSSPSSSRNVRHYFPRAALFCSPVAAGHRRQHLK